MSAPDSPEATDPAVDPGASDVADTELRAARRVLVLFAVAVVSAVVALAVVVLGAGGGNTVEPERPVSEPVSDLGPGPGADLAGYVDDRARALREAEGRRVAIMSFSDYLTDDEAGALVESDALEVRAWLLALPGGEPRLDDDVEAFRHAELAMARTQIDELESLLPTVDDQEFIDFYRDELHRYRTMIDRSAAPAVFGAVVVARSPDLRALQSRAGVRLVDVGASSLLGDGAVVSGLRPEETSTAGRPPTRPT